MRSLPTPALAGLLFVAALLLVYLLNLVAGPWGVAIIAVAVIAVGLYLDRDWMSYGGGLLICAGLTADVLMDLVQTGSFFAGLFSLVMLSAVGVCAMISAGKLQADA